MDGSPTVVSAEYVEKWFACNHPYGVPTNAAEIAPTLDAEYKRLLYSDPTPVQFSMSLGDALRYYELFPGYLNGKISGAPHPVFVVCALYQPGPVSPFPAVGDTLSGDDAADVLYGTTTLKKAMDERCEGDSIAMFHVTFSNERDLDSYRITRVADYEQGA